MNERIRELEKQCWDNQTNHLDTEKFAEMIVNECLMTIAMHDLVPGHSAFSEMIYERQVELLRDVCEEIKEHLCKNS